MSEDLRQGPPEICISIDVERDYRLDGRLTTRGIDEGLPTYLDHLRSIEVPYDVFVSGEIVSMLPGSMLGLDHGTGALGCHGLRHEAGLSSYLNRKPRSFIERELRTATDVIRSKFGHRPTHFRAPNFSTSAETISVLEALGYRSDSSVLPGRHVRRWKAFTVLDHRGAPMDPYHPDHGTPVREGSSRILEVPVTPNPFSRGSPLGLGFLHHSGLESVLPAIDRIRTRYVIFLAHSWEMVSWESSDPVANWVRRSSSASTKSTEQLVTAFHPDRFVNMDRIVEAEAASWSPDGRTPALTPS